MPFPDEPRVIYEVNPLDEVICQVRFPTILKIESDAPTEFQEKIRADFPFYELTQPLKLPAGFPPQLVQSFVADLPMASRKSHSFGSKDRQWNLNLTREYVSLTCQSYRRWEEFKQKFQGPFEALQSTYRPSFFTRIGLRYKDVIRRSRLGLENIDWRELIQPWISGILGPGGVSDETQGTSTSCIIKLPDAIGQVQLNFGLAVSIDDGTATGATANQEVVFVIDADLFNDQQTEINDVFNRLDALKRQSGLLFRWCITKRLHDALRPSPVPSS